MTDNPPITDPRDDVRGRARVTDTPELHAFYDELAKHNAGAFWKRANAIEPWERESRYRPTLWRYADMRAMCLRAKDLGKPEEAGRRVRTLLNASDAGRGNVAVCGWVFTDRKSTRLNPSH